ncbi:MAG TPA: hypothetical protein VFR56_03585 [Actinomycetes bacterium]|nr:hypothetical protein [Actinomycetes bacterium]
MSSSTKLVVVFNHRYDRNLPLLDRIYADRFDVTYLVPFYRGDNPRVSAVYESSHQFQGYVAQGLPDLLSPSATHYAFVADDMLLHPRLDASTLADALHLGPGTGWIKGLADLAAAPFAWTHLLPAVSLWHRNTGVEHAGELPDEATARALVGRHLAVSDRLSARGLLDFHGRFDPRDRPTRRTAAHLLRHPRQRHLPYPLVWGYSDFCVVPAEAVERFAHWCGVFAAMGLFVEVAMPTALAMACEEIRTEESDPGAPRGVELWEAEEQQALVRDHGGDLDRLTAAFPDDWLYVHPVKLSGWTLPAARPAG